MPYSPLSFRWFLGGPHSLAHQDAVAEPVSARVAAVLPRPSAALLGATFFIRVFVGIHKNQQADITPCFHRRRPHRGSLHQDVGNHAVVWIHTDSASRSVEGILLSRSGLYCPSYQPVKRKQRHHLQGYRQRQPREERRRSPCANITCILLRGRGGIGIGLTCPHESSPTAAGVSPVVEPHPSHNSGLLSFHGLFYCPC